MISIKNLSKKYGSKKVLDAVDFEFPQNKLIAFIGSNGAGKSTLLSIISRTLSKTQGDIYIDEKKLENWQSSDLAKRLAVLKQSNEVDLRITVEELVSFGRFPHSQGKLTQDDKEIIQKAIDYMDISHIRNAFIHQLSGGQRQMAYIAMVIAQDTEYIFLDEPLNNLDMKHSVKIMQILERLVKEKGKTVMVVIHDINFVSTYSDYIVAMKDGKIISGGYTKEMMNSAVLKKVYNMDIEVKEVNNKKICLYYT